jgi:PAS domain S-box-containing protein
MDADTQSILIVEDETIVALELKFQLRDMGYAVTEIVTSGEEAIKAVDRHPVNLILMDVRLQGLVDGIDAALAIRRDHDIPVIFLTSHSDTDTVQRAARSAPYGYLTKPYQLKELRAGIEVALTKARMERQLRQADRWFAHTLQCVADGVIVTDLDARVRFVNPAAERLTGWAIDEALGQEVGAIVRFQASVRPAITGVAPGLHDDATALVRAVLHNGRPVPVAHALGLLSRSGTEKPVDETAAPVDDDKGKRLGAVLVLRDAAERVAREALLRASEARFRNAFDFAPLGMALVSMAGEIIQANDALCRLLGTGREQLSRANQAELTVEADRDHEARRLRELASAPGGVVQFEKCYLRPAGQEPVCTLVSVSLMQDDGQSTCYLYQVHDLTEQNLAAQHLAALADERMRRVASELANTSKTEFLSRVSHEMRTPLNAVIGFAQLLQLQAASDPPRIHTYAEHIRAAGEHLLALVTDLLDLNQVAQGGLKLVLEPVNLSAVVSDVLRWLQGQAQVHGIELVTSMPRELVVLADARRLRQVLLNLGSNAVKYNRQGGRVTISAALLSTGRVTLSVKDGGIGMTPEQLDRLFQPFERLGAERTKVPGTGLGLVIARSLMAEMHGLLAVQSTPRGGTTVTIELQASA